MFTANTLMKLFPLSRFKVHGDSMLPFLKEGEDVVSFNWAYNFSEIKIGDVVVAKIKNLLIIKRVFHIDGRRIFLKGDHEIMSTDSRNFGWLDKRQILGKAIIFIRR